MKTATVYRPGCYSTNLDDSSSSCYSLSGHPEQQWVSRHLVVPGIGSREGEDRNLRTGDAEEGGNPQARDRQSLTAWLLQMPGLRRQGYLQEKMFT
jgi:hypothetical protein